MLARKRTKNNRKQGDKPKNTRDRVSRQLESLSKVKAEESKASTRPTPPNSTQAHFSFLEEMILLDLCAVCNYSAISDKTKKVSNAILLDLVQTSSLNNLLKEYCVPSAQTAKGLWPSWALSNNLCPDDIPVELASLSLDEVRIISLICPFLKVIILPGG